MKVNRYVILLLSCLLCVSMWGQYNPANPAEPGMSPWKLTLRAVPSDAGSFNISSVTKHATGEKVSLRAYTNSSFVFKAWEDEEGNVLSTTASFSYTMPAKHVTLIARYTYGSSNPSEPSEPVKYVTLNFSASPSEGGSVSPSGAQKYQIGSKVNLRAYNYSDFSFVNWTLNGEVISTSSSLSNYEVSESGSFVAHFKYAPGNPAEPAPAVLSHPLYLKANPSEGGYFNISSGNVHQEGESIFIRSYSNTYYTFKNWTQDGEVISTDYQFNYTMPNRAATLVANYEYNYNPGNPGEPGASTTQRYHLYGMHEDGIPGQMIKYPVYLENTSEITGFSIDLAFPEGITPDAANATLTERTEGHTLQVESLGNNAYRFFIRGSEAVKGANGKVLEIPLTIPATEDVGTIYTVGLSKGAIFKGDGSQTSVTVRSGSLKIVQSPEEIPDSPDFFVSDINVTETETGPGETLHLSWKVNNVGSLEALAGWSERLYLVSANGKKVSIGTTYYETSSLEAGGTVSRNADISLGKLLGIEGDSYVSITIVPNASAGEIVECQGNNTTDNKTKKVLVKKLLYLTLPATILTEGEITTAKCQLARSGNWTATEEFSLTVTGDARLTVPATVKIPKEQSSVSFFLTLENNNLLDENTQFAILASGNGYEAVSGNVTVEDDELPSITVTSSKSEVNEGDTFQLTVTLARPSASPVDIGLMAEYPKRFSLPSQVTIPAGESSVKVTVTVADDELPSLQLSNAFTASAAGYTEGTVIVLLNDDDIPALELTLTPNRVSESAGVTSIAGILRRTGKTDNKITVKLTDDAGGKLYFSNRSLELAKGVEEIHFNFGPVDNAQVDGDRTYTITAAVWVSSCSCSASGESAGNVSAKLEVYDDDGASLTLATSSATVKEGGQTTLTISRNTATDQALTLNLSSDYDDNLTYDHTVVIPKGQSSATVSVTSKVNEVSDDSHTVVFTVTAEGYSPGTCYLMVTDQTLPDARISSLVADKQEASVGELTILTIEVTNDGVIELPAEVSVKIYHRGESSAVATLYTSEAIAVGASKTLTRTITLPTTVGTHYYYAVINEANKVKELSYTNNTSAEVSIQTTAPFTVTLSTDKKIYKQGDKVLISGQLAGKNTTDTDIDLYVINEGARQVKTVKTDGHGTFTYEWELYALQSGYFSVGACYPGEGLTKELASFDAYGLRRSISNYITCEVANGETDSGIIELFNSGNLALTNVKAEVISAPSNCEAVVEVPSSINGGQTAQLKYSLKGVGPSSERKWDEVKVRITASEGVTLNVTLYFYCYNSTANLVADVKRITASITKGSTRDYPLHIVNTGKGASGEITLVLPEWMSCVSGNTIASMNQNDTTTVVLHMITNDKMQLNLPVTGTIGVNCMNGNGLTIDYSVEPVSEETGFLQVDVCDEYTYNTIESPHVAGAVVVVKHPYTGAELMRGTTDENGLFSVELPEGYYKVEVSADKHENYTNYCSINPGKTEKIVVNISYQPITIHWGVEETEVEDEYEITTTVVYETNAPMPVVKVTLPKSIDGDNMAVGDNVMVNMLLTNVGLICAEQVELDLPTNMSEWKFEALAYTEPFTLAPQQMVAVPVKITRITDGTAGTSRTRSMAEDMVHSYQSCMAGMGSWYKGRCGKDLKTNHAAERMAMKTCAASATMQAIGSVLSGVFGGGGLGGPGGGGGGGSGTGSGGGGSTNYNGVTQTIDLCDPCDAARVEAAINVALGFTWAGSINDALQNAAEAAQQERDNRDAANRQGNASRGNSGEGSGPGPGFFAKEIGKNTVDTAIGTALDIKVGDGASNFYSLGKGIYDTVTACDDLETNQARGKSRQSYRNVSRRSWMEEYDAIALEYIEQVKIMNSLMHYAFGDSIWYTDMDMQKGSFIKYICELPEGYMPSEEELLAKKPESVTLAQMNAYVNHVIVGETDGPQTEDYEQLLSTFMEMNFASKSRGYSSMTEEFAEAYKNYQKQLENMSSSSVCATITLQFKQTMTMTRQAFRGTLEVFNGHESIPMEDVKLNLLVTKKDGQVATSHEFEMHTESINGFTGSLELGSNWTLKANTTGTATILFIPTKYAAPTEPLEWSFGGTLSYVDPFTGLEVTRELFPVTLTVKPSPELDLTYFMQRDIYGDDALTLDVVEPMQPAEFALLINNKGNGDATNVRMVTQQPEIIENEKGLYIDFEIVSSQVNGGEANLAFGKSIANDFGTIPAHSQAYAQWWMTSTLLGHFTEYDVQANHLTSYGNEDLSLLGDVTIHELIHSLDLSAGDQKMVGFLVNDITDAEDMPDMLYLSNGETAEVAVATSCQMSRISNTSYSLTVNASAPGWVYGNLIDPSAGMSTIKSIRRQSDGKEINLRNFWQTDRTLRDGKDPLYEYRIHFADELVSGTTETYLLNFDPLPDTVLAVEQMDGVPEEGTVAVDPVNLLTVKFNKAIQTETFTADDLTFAVQGVRQDASQIGISTTDNKSFNLDLEALTAQCSNGYYTMTVQTAGITDAEGFKGKNGKQVGWILFRGGLVQLLTSAWPENSGTVTRKPSDAAGARTRADQADDNTAEYGSMVVLTASPSEGYEFSNWTMNGEVVSTDPEFETKALGDMDIVANFTKKSYQVNVEASSDGGTITGMGTGFYEYKTTLELAAVPLEDFMFKNWVVNGRSLDNNISTLSIPVDKTLDVKAKFVREYYRQSLSLEKGWNWISCYLNEHQSIADLARYVSRIVSQTDELVYDPEYGMVGTISELEAGRAYKIQSNRTFNSSYRGHLYDTATAPVSLHKGWNWVAYPYVESASVGSVIKNAEEGDYVASQTGFAEYSNHSWEGSLDLLVPGEGYLYKSQTNKDLQFDFSGVANIRQAVRSRAHAVTEAVVDIRRYPNTMNVTAQICRDGIGLSSDKYTVYAMTGGELRGMSQCIGQNHYLTVYGDSPIEVTFLIESVETGETFVAKETLAFRDEVVGSRKSPFLFNIGSATGIESISGDRPMTVYNLQGILVSRDATLKTLHRLPKGVYIVNGQKCFIK